MKHLLEQQLRGLLTTVTSLGGHQYVEEKRLSLMERKDRCVSLLSTVGPLLAPALHLASYVSPAQAGLVQSFCEGVGLLLAHLDPSRLYSIVIVHIN